jgi:hypothetical protein
LREVANCPVCQRNYRLGALAQLDAQRLNAC